VEQGQSGRALRYQPALDGLRAVAVAAVVCFHGFALQSGSPGRGGFLGVDVFFVLSGYLITSLLVVEYTRAGRIGLRSFWFRRVRRLLPALTVALLLLALYAATEPAAQRAGLRGDAFFTLIYAQNWRAVWTHGTTAFTPLSHTWSLSIEEQWYLVWPIALGAGLRLTKLRVRVVLAIVIALAIASAVWMGVLYSAFDRSRAHYGTDTRAQALLVGAALALVFGHDRMFTNRATRYGVEAAGWSSAAYLGYQLVWARGTDSFLYHGGFFLVAVATAFVIAAATRCDGPLRRVLSWKPLVLLGLISYGVYLYHLPLFELMTPTRVGMTGAPLFIFRTAATLLVSYVSFRYLERPIREGTRKIKRMPALVPVALVAVLAVAFVSVLRQPPRPSSIRLTTKVVAYFEHRRLTTPPNKLRVLVAGESQAFVLQQHLRDTFTDPNIDGVSFGLFGCAIGAGDIVTAAGGFLPRSHDCDQWPKVFRQLVDAYRPSVVVLMVGDQEVFDRAVGDQLLQVGTSAWKSMLNHQLDLARAALVADGARLIVTTSPCPNSSSIIGAFRTTERSARRRQDVNTALREYASLRHLQLGDLAALLCPDGRPLRVHGADVISQDATGLTDKGAELVWQWIADRVTEGAPQP
jgi:peptidoglycan/LPS O-acetylase OafA/YrhL